MIRNRLIFFACALLLSLGSGIKAQTSGDSISFDMLELEGKLLLFVDKIDAISADVTYANLEQLAKAEKEITSIDNKWNMFTQAYQLDIALDEKLLNLVTRYQEDKQQLTDTIQFLKHRLESFDAFMAAEIYIERQKEPYNKRLEEAKRYSQMEKLAPMLEKLKAKEQQFFAELEKNYEKAKEAAQTYDLLQDRMKKLEENYIELKIISDTIQATEYKPFIERIKDYLLSFAAVAIILMFINMVHAKIQSYKQLRKSAEEYKKALMGNDEETPSI
ncbi:MAG: hypothetical protein J6S05_00840 [Bacteroidaceae bacterium]|jgi:hypothetical protein|nr:hypothetical protein [Bacteroidaceae bacterium]